MVRSGYAPLFADEALGEQLARAITVRIMRAAQPHRPLGGAHRGPQHQHGAGAVARGRADALRGGARRATRASPRFAGELARTLDSIPMDSCRAAPSPAWRWSALACTAPWWRGSRPPRRSAPSGLLVGDTVVAVDGDSVSAGGLLMPDAPAALRLLRPPPRRAGHLDIRRGGRVYGIQIPINWGMRAVTRVASQSRAAVEPICTWVRRAVRQ